MVTFLNKIRNMFKKSECTCLNHSKQKLEYFVLDVDWSDISLGNSSNYIVNSMKRHGIYGYPTNSMIVLEDGSEYIPENLSDHWEGFNNSNKFKPKKIVYNRLEDI